MFLNYSHASCANHKYRILKSALNVKYVTICLKIIVKPSKMCTSANLSQLGIMGEIIRCVFSRMTTTENEKISLELGQIL